jgi:DNA-binding Lrp family transcriptional regulator
MNSKKHPLDVGAFKKFISEQIKYLLILILVYPYFNILSREKIKLLKNLLSQIISKLHRRFFLMYTNENDIDTRILRKHQAIDKRRINFTMVQNEIIDEDNLTVYEKMVYIVLCRFASNKTDRCYPSYETIAKRAGCSRPKCIQVVKSLIEKGLISKEMRKGEHEFMTNYYYINDIPKTDTEESSQEELNQEELINVDDLEGGSKSHLLGGSKQDLLGDKHALLKQYLVNNTNINNNNSQLVSQNTNINIDSIENKENQKQKASQSKEDLEQSKIEIQEIIINAKVELFENTELQNNIIECIEIAYKDVATKETIKKLKLHHIDLAISKFKAMQETKEISNPKIYFLKTLISAINEFGIKSLF